MEKILKIYLIATNVVTILSFIGFVALISTKISKRNPLNVMGWIFLITTLIGMYLFVPSRLFVMGVVNQNINYLENAIRLSINPIEKQLCRQNLLDIYISNNDYKKAQKIFNEMNKNIQNKYNESDLPKKVNKIRKLDLILFEAQNNYNVKMKEYSKKIEKLRTDSP